MGSSGWFTCGEYKTKSLEEHNNLKSLRRCNLVSSSTSEHKFYQEQI